MERYQLNQEMAYRKLLNTEFYKLLNDIDTGLYLETDEYLCNGCVVKLEKGKSALYEYSNM